MSEDKKKIKGSPTKDLFIYVLTRDLSLEDAINDLIDNCIDGAKRLRPKGDYKDLWIKIHLDKGKFIIEDNCGGIPIEIAREYAFRFGRPENVDNTGYSIGQFGVGMKRAFFKLGKDFYVHSTASNSEFAVAVSIEDWLSKKTENGDDDWSFEFKNDFKEGIDNDVEKIGTEIEVTPLHEEVSDYVSKTNFVQRLKLNIERKHMENIFKGIDIFLNNEKLRSIRPEFRVSEQIKISKFTYTFPNQVELEIFCGIGDPVEDDGGWYIFCNDRLLLGPEQSPLTGWTGESGDGGPLYHHQFRYFRGIVYFKSENSFKLPWNTAKNDIDASSNVFLFARGKMIEMMKPVIKLLNLVKKDRESTADGSPKQYQPYLKMVNDTNTITLSEIKGENTSISFKVPKIEKIDEPGDKFVTINYKKPKDLVNYLKDVANVASNKELGEMTFDYYLEQEDIEYE